MTTLKDIAKKCNVSFSTVSKALKDSSEIGEDTIRLVKETAHAMGYHPNAAAQALRTKHSYDLGVIFEDKTGSGLQHQYFATIFDSLNVEANSEGYDITFINDDRKNDRDYFAHAKYRGCDGIAVVTTEFSRPDIIELLNSSIPAVTLDHVVDNRHTAVISDNKEGIRELVEYAASCGHSKIAMIHGEKTDVTADRISSFLESAEKHHIQIPSGYLQEGIYHDPESSAKATEKLLALPDPPTCIFYPDDFSVLGGIRILDTLHLKPGRDISIAGYDGILMSTMLSPPLTTYQQNGKLLGAELARQLIMQIEHPLAYTPCTVNVSGRLLTGKSVISIL